MESLIVLQQIRTVRLRTVPMTGSATKSYARRNKKVCILGLILALQSLFCVTGVSAQMKLEYWDNSEQYIQDQASLIFEQVFEVLDAHPPIPEAGIERRLALSALDALLHDPRLDNGEAFYGYMKCVGQRLADALEKGRPKRGIRFFRVYNHGFIVQTPSITIGIDLFRGGSRTRPFLNDSLILSLVSQCDILFVTHAHGDHADPDVAKMFCEQNKPVIVPPGLWENVSPHIKSVRGASMTTETVGLPGTNTQLTFHVFPGHQREVINNIYAIVTPEGKTVMHTGDQSNDEDLKWIADIHSHVKTDILLAHCWMMPLEEIIAAIRPSTVISGHENEMGHTIDHREAYWLTFRRMSNIKVPCVIMGWGESYTCE
ncbi:MAG: MBL fold metallo-hydrolase [Tannerellaceae bacterium]|jgi:L-ascorbate metabolism protein UlaG (beta-lactamase superfamily)|nr:MBL fold metallo-hydrolase [Tannerellaceae bacterium]